ncbi:hypothetical protein V0288_23710 [Pannus brasiliensis CCIBt3594]|uniref:Uncharacterized protein n=1 Tax=Pannus brasiliensis CCIBt3594 TaxID=1427578 RepID=A0AAW9QZA8_9CHRO
MTRLICSLVGRGGLQSSPKKRKIVSIAPPHLRGRAHPNPPGPETRPKDRGEVDTGSGVRLLVGGFDPLWSPVGLWLALALWLRCPLVGGVRASPTTPAGGPWLTVAGRLSVGGVVSVGGWRGWSGAAGALSVGVAVCFARACGARPARSFLGLFVVFVAN